MDAAGIMQQIEELPEVEQQKLFVLLTRKIIGGQSANAKQWLGKELSFKQACDIVFRENRELLVALAN